MTVEPDTEPWMPNGFPPPSFVVGRQRVSTVVSSRSRWILAAALLGLVLLVAGLLQLTRGGSDRTALKAGPATPAPADLSPGPPAIFPPGSDTEPIPTTEVIPPPPPTLPVVPPGAYVTPSTTAQKVTIPAAGPAPARPPAPTPPARAPSTPTPKPSTSPPSTSSPSTTSAPVPTPPRIDHADGSDRFAQSNPCDGPWTVRAKVLFANGDQVTGVYVVRSGPGGSPDELPMTPDQQGIWTAGPVPGVAASVGVEILARVTRGLNSAEARSAPVETYDCPPPPP